MWIKYLINEVGLLEISQVYLDTIFVLVGWFCCFHSVGSGSKMLDKLEFEIKYASTKPQYLFTNCFMVNMLFEHRLNVWITHLTCLTNSTKQERVECHGSPCSCRRTSEIYPPHIQLLRVGQDSIFQSNLQGNFSSETQDKIATV